YEQPAASGAYFLQVRFELLEHLVVGRDRNHRHVLVDQRQRAVLELGRRIRLGVNVGYFLELQRPLHGDGGQRAAPDEQRVVLIDEGLREGSDGFVERQRLLHETRQLQQLNHEPALLLRSALTMFGERDDQHGKGRELRGEGFGGGNADFRPRAGK